jgi:hypothetical protein
VHKGNSNISLVNVNQAKILISSSKKYVLLFPRETQSGEDSLKVKTSMKGCTKEWKHELEEFLKECQGVF